MWTALSTLGTGLLVLKYAGLCLAAGSSIWGTVNELVDKVPDGTRRLTKAGLVAISFTVLGLIISLVSEDLQRRENDASHLAQVAAEAKRTNEIIVSGQLLTSLKLHWQFASKNPQLEQAMADGSNGVTRNSYDEQGGVPEVPFDVEDYQQLLMPLISFVANPAGAPKPNDQGGSKKEESKPSSTKKANKQGSTVVLMAMDASANTILSFGTIGNDAAWTSGGEDNDKRTISAGFVESEHKVAATHGLTSGRAPRFPSRVSCQLTTSIGTLTRARWRT